MRQKALSLFFVVLCLFVTACGAQENQSSDKKTGEELTATDARGENITLDGPAERIICLTGLCIDILAELGIEPVADTNTALSSHPAFFGEKGKTFPPISGSFGQENLEEIIAADPHLVIGLDGVHDGLREGLKSSVPLYIAGTTSYTDSIKVLKDIGRLVGQSEKAENAAQAFLDKLAVYKAKTPKNKSALVMYGASPDFGIETNIAIVGGLISEVTNYPWPAANPNAPAHSRGLETHSLEKVLQTDPDVLFVQTIAFGPTEPLSKQLAANPVWKELKAVKNGQVHEVSFTVWGTGRGTRTLSLVLDEAMTMLYPDVFPQPLS